MFSNYLVNKHGMYIGFLIIFFGSVSTAEYNSTKHDCVNQTNLSSIDCFKLYKIDVCACNNCSTKDCSFSKCKSKKSCAKARAEIEMIEYDDRSNDENKLLNKDNTNIKINQNKVENNKHFAVKQPNNFKQIQATFKSNTAIVASSDTTLTATTESSSSVSSSTDATTTVSVTDTSLTVTSTISSSLTDTATQSQTDTATQSLTDTTTQSLTDTATQSQTDTTTQSQTDTTTQSQTDTTTQGQTDTTTQSQTDTTTQSQTDTTTQSLTDTTTQSLTDTTTQSLTDTTTQSFTDTTTQSLTDTTTQSLTDTTTQSQTDTTTQSLTDTTTLISTDTEIANTTETASQNYTESATANTTEEFNTNATESVGSSSAISATTSQFDEGGDTGECEHEFECLDEAGVCEPCSGYESIGGEIIYPYRYEWSVEIACGSEIPDPSAMETVKNKIEETIPTLIEDPMTSGLFEMIFHNETENILMYIITTNTDEEGSLNEIKTNIDDAITTAIEEIEAEICEGLVITPGELLDIDECELGLSKCSDDAICLNKPGTYQCICGIDYFGDGFECKTADNCTDISEEELKDKVCVNFNGMANLLDKTEESSPWKMLFIIFIVLFLILLTLIIFGIIIVRT